MTYQNPAFTPASPPPKRHTGLIVGLIVAAAFLALCGVSVASCAAIGGSNDNSSGTSSVQTKPAVVGLNQATRDGKFEFTVTQVESTSRVGSVDYGEKAQGQFILITVIVRNIGKEAQMFDGSSQKAYDTVGHAFSNDTTAEFDANEGSTTFLQDINPGNQVKGNLVFDVPKSAKLVKLELHDSPFSSGTIVQIG